MTLNEWAARHNVSPAALAELSQLLVAHELDASVPLELRNDVGTSEAAVQARTRIAVSRMGWRVFRNNRGAGIMSTGSFVRFGLANDSAAMNESIKSSDLIGIRPVRITPLHVGSIVGQFVSLECKPDGWKYKATPHEVAQKKWIDLIVSLGGHARFVTNEGDVN